MGKRLYLLLCMVMIASVCSAHVVTEPTAQKIAKSFFASNPQTKASAASLKLLWDGLEMGPSTKSFSMTPPFYVYGLDGEDGFVIVAGDDICRPVLGYSYAQSFDPDNIPDGLRDWFEMVRSMVNDGSKKKISASAAVSKEWTTKAANYTVVKKLETALWNQGAPYNWKTPILDESCGHTLTGCVSTAAAIVMKYWSYPEAGTGTLDDYTYTSNGVQMVQKGHSLGHKYEWDKMLMNYYNGYTTEQGNAVATLMFDLGVMNYSHWGNTETSALCLPGSYSTYMGYDKNMISASPSEFQDINKWHSYLRKEIDEGRPVLYSGIVGGYIDGKFVLAPTGHEFVLDGYATDDYYSFNWGWGGSSNGYFTIDPSKGNENLISYVYNQEAVLGMMPEDGIDNKIDFPLRIPYILSDIAYAVRHKQKKFSIQGSAYVVSLSSVTKKLRIALMRDSKVVKYLTDEVEYDFSNGWASWGFTANTFTDFSRGDYICVGYTDKDGDWIPCGDDDGRITLVEETSLHSGCLSISDFLQFEIDGEEWFIGNMSKQSYVEIYKDSKQIAQFPSSNKFKINNLKGSELTVIIYDLFESYEMTVKL